jgi:hypothetical protein
MTLEELNKLFKTNEAEAMRIWNNSGIAHYGSFEDYYAAMGKNATVSYYSAELT